MSVLCFEGGQLTPSLALWRHSLVLPTWSSIWRGSSRGKWRAKDALQGSQPPFSPFARSTSKSILVTADPLNISSLNTCLLPSNPFQLCGAMLFTGSHVAHSVRWPGYVLYDQRTSVWFPREAGFVFMSIASRAAVGFPHGDKAAGA
jgi:hypothetical protein